jgi:hypothetical protein
MASYVKNLDELIDFHPEVHTNLLQATATLDPGELVKRLAVSKNKIIARNDFEAKRVDQILAKFGTLEEWQIFSA